MGDDNSPRIAVIGCGAIAGLYHLPALVRDRSVRDGLILVDVSETRSRDLAQRFGITRTATNYRDLIGAIDGVIIATPPASHCEIALFFLRHGVHVLCEKPLAETAAEAHEMVNQAAAHRVTLSVNQTRRLFPTYGAIRNLIANGELGEITSIRYHDGTEFSWPAATEHHFRPGAKGALSDTGIHLLDTICWWLDAKPLLVESLQDSFGGPEAIATVRLRHALTNIEVKVSRLGRLSNRFRIEGTRGVIDAGVEDWSQVTIISPQGQKRHVKCDSTAADYNDFAIPLINNFINVIRHQAKPLIAGDSTLPGVELLELAYKQAKPFAMPWNSHWMSFHAA